MASNRQRLVGMRIIKTVIGVFLCGLFGYLRGQPAFYSMIAAVVCMQNSTEKTITTSINRAIGTLMGGLYGVVLLYLMGFLGVQDYELLRYFLVSLTIIPLIRTALVLKRPSSASISCVVFLSITVNHVVDDIPALFALQRMVDTLAGVVVTCVIDLALPYHPKPQEEAVSPPQETPELLSQEEAAPTTDTPEEEESPKS